MEEFDAVIQAGPGGGAMVEVPFDAKEVFGSGRPKVVARFDGTPYRGSIASRGGRYVLGVTKGHADGHREGAGRHGPRHRRGRYGPPSSGGAG